MKTLLSLFNQERASLQAEIDKATAIEQVVKLVQNRLDRLEKNYISELNVAQVRLASFFLDTLRQSIATLLAATPMLVPLPDEKENFNPITKVSPNKLILKSLQGLISVGILSSLFSISRIAPGAWMAILLTSILLGLEVVLQLDKTKSGNNANPPLLPPAPPPILKVDSTLFLDNLADALNTIDLAVPRISDTNKPLDAAGIEELPELLSLIQRLWGASVLEKPQMALELARLLPQVLMEQGIRALIYQPNEERNHREYFDFEPSIDRNAKEHVTIVPALLKGDRLLRRGRVVEPAYSQKGE
ncbi:MAG TPA: hypothetical protein V6D28_22415 [Leptolyngbyaceae cyanobacterium]